MSGDPLVVACRRCGQRLRVPADRAADVGRCPRCGRTFRAAGPRVGRRAALAAGGAVALAAGAGWWVWPAGEEELPLGPPAEDGPSAVPVGEPARVACVGDSITAGGGLADPAADAWPARLGILLGPLYEVRGFGAGGRSAGAGSDYPYADTPEAEAARRYAPHRLVVALGTNDAWPQNWRRRDRFAADYAALVQSYRELPTRPRAYLCTPPPVFGPVPGGLTADKVVWLAERVRAVAGRLRLPLVDLHARLADAGGLFPDHLHPDPAGADRIAGEVAGVIAADGG